MITKTIEDYCGAALVDRHPVGNATTELSAAKIKRGFEDVAQMTATACRAIVRFKVSAAATVLAADVFVRSVWGNGDAAKPVITRQASGVYTLTWATTYTDAIGYVETVSFFDAHGKATTLGESDPMSVEPWYIAGNIVKAYVLNPATSAPIPADVGPLSGDPVYVTVWVY